MLAVKVVGFYTPKWPYYHHLWKNGQFTSLICPFFWYFSSFCPFLLTQMVLPLPVTMPPFLPNIILLLIIFILRHHKPDQKQVMCDFIKQFCVFAFLSVNLSMRLMSRDTERQKRITRLNVTKQVYTLWRLKLRILLNTKNSICFNTFFSGVIEWNNVGNILSN